MNFDLAPRVLWFLAAIFAVLIVASVAVWLLGRGGRGKGVDELRARVRSWWVMVVVFSLAMLFSRVISLVFFAAISYLALREYLAIIPTRACDRRVIFWAYAAIPVQYLWIGIEWYGMFIIFVPIYIFLLIPLRMVLIGETEGFLRAAGTIHWGLMVTVFGISHLAFLLVLPGEINPNGGSPALVLFVVVLTQFNDVAQFIWGKMLGRHPVVPRVSPKKTVEGLLGGIATTTGLAVLLSGWLTPFDLREAVIMGVVLGLGGFLGDVVISAVKRDLGIKDTGALLPGHGGILDRIDSLTYTAPLFFHYVRYFHGG